MNHGLRLVVSFLAAAPAGFSSLSFVFGPVALGLWSYNRGEQCIVHPQSLLQDSKVLEDSLKEVETKLSAFSTFDQLDRAYRRKVAASQMLQVTPTTAAAATTPAAATTSVAATTSAAATTPAAVPPPATPVIQPPVAPAAPAAQAGPSKNFNLPPAPRVRAPVNAGQRMSLWLLVTGCVGTVLGVFMVVTVVHDAVWAREMEMMQHGRATRLWLDIKAFLYQPWFFFDVVGLSLVFMLFVFLFFWVIIGSVWVWGANGLACQTQSATLWGNMNGYLITVWLAALVAFIAMVVAGSQAQNAESHHAMAGKM
jgi:hypothetical protein